MTEAMKVVHQGYQVTGLVGHMSATITEESGDGAYVQIVLTDMGGTKTSYDLNGLANLIRDLGKVLDIAEATDRCNAVTRET